ncbi:MAG: ThiF family adenylyltransferase [Burkholderiaceae bacterium]|nr:ThiF family adenylyltransferase [Burkholderiaceae bacterium]
MNDSTAAPFSYSSAFSRNIGWVTRDEQARLRAKRIAIAGMGGVGGAHLLTLTRLGIGAFNVSDFDTFDVVNLNRQAGAMLRTMGRPKAQVLAEMAEQINPDVSIQVQNDGVHSGNVDRFLEGADLYVDGLDFFAFEARKLIFAECERRRIPAVTVAPLGMGAALLNFVPGGMSFERYFRWNGCDEDEMAIRFLVGLSPAMLQRSYLVDPGAVDLVARRGPSTAMACELSAGIAATEALKLLLERGKVLSAPRGMQFDAYRNRVRRTWRPGGNGNPIQRIAIGIARRQLAAMRRAQRVADAI